MSGDDAVRSAGLVVRGEGDRHLDVGSVTLTCRLAQARITSRPGR